VGGADGTAGTRTRNGGRPLPFRSARGGGVSVGPTVTGAAGVGGAVPAGAAALPEEVAHVVAGEGVTDAPSVLAAGLDTEAPEATEPLAPAVPPLLRPPDEVRAPDLVVSLVPACAPPRATAAPDPTDDDPPPDAEPGVDDPSFDEDRVDFAADPLPVAELDTVEPERRDVTHRHAPGATA
jgi:hypothetical protein